MEVVLGVSMTPSAVRMVLVEGAGGDGATQDTNVCEVIPGGAAEQVVAAILGTRESVADGAHRLTAVGVAWTEHADGARLREVLQASDVDDVVMVSELHAASALAQAVGRRTGCARTALLFLERSDVTLAVVRTADGAVVAVRSRALLAGNLEEILPDLQGMVAECERSAEPPEAVFVMGAGFVTPGGDPVDTAELAARIAAGTTLPVRAPEDADMALARGAALAAAGAPRFEARTAVVAGVAEPSADTAVGATRLAAAGYAAALGYSEVDDDDPEPGFVTGIEDADPASSRDEDSDDESAADPVEKPFLLVGSTLATIFVVGVLALVISLAVRISPTADQRPQPDQTIAPPGPAAVQENRDNPVVPQAQPSVPAPSLETIPAPVPVVQEAPRTLFVPAPAAPAPAPAAVPAPVAPAPAATVPVPAAPPATVTVPAAPAPVVPPIVVAPLIPMLPPFLQSPVRIPAVPATRAPATSAPVTSAPAPATSAPVSTAPVTSAPVTSGPTASAPTASAPTTTVPTIAAPVISTPSAASPGSSAAVSAPEETGASGGGSRSRTPVWPLWPDFGG